MTGTVLMSLLFLMLALPAIGLIWYNRKYKKRINIGAVLILNSVIIGVMMFMVIRQLMGNEKERIINDISVRNTVIKISSDRHKPYFKNMHLNDGTILPMPASMERFLQIDDSIYKNKGENFYTLVALKTKVRKKFEVKVHERVLGKPQ